ncbi:MAG: CotH kinase family protein [Bacteroidales bacterium]|nr:CotH kinase family protein [Bacteroidales bacterium]
MKILFTLLSLLLILQLSVSSQVLINEIQTSNKSTLADEDGDYEDWIELYNASSSLVNLENFGLSDNPLEPFKWKLPNVELSPGGHLLVFASGKDRKPLLNHWETAIFADESWKYFIGTENPPFNWKENNFPAAGWLEGPGGIGYGDGDDGTVIPPTISVYMRKTFLVPDKSAISYCVLHMDYDDGFVAYLNGFEIARSNLTGIPPAFDEITTSDHEAQMYQGGIPEVYLVDSLLLNAILVDGQNVLAIQTHNSGALSSDLSSIPFLSFGIKNSNSYFQPTPAWFPAYAAGDYHTNFKLKHSGETVVLSSPNGDLLDQVQLSFTDLDHSQCRVPDGGSGWCISMNPTPDGSNNSTVCYSGYTVRPEFTTVPGFYNQETEVAITTSNPGSTIHYTTNGNIPNESDPVYNLPLYIGSTTVIRARCFGPSGFLPGKVNTGTFLIGEANPKLPVVSVSTDSSNLWDFFSGIYVTGPNAEPNFPFFGANFWQPWEKDCHVEYFGPVQERKFELDAGLSIHGGWSRAFAQKSFNIKCRPYYDSSEIHYKLFGDKPMMDYSGFILRNSGNDWLSTFMRDALMQRLMKKSHVDYTGYCPAVTYLNGSYWGIYNIRERSNKDFVELNHGVDADNVDMIESDGIVAEGNSDSFWEMVEFMTTHELSLPENYAIADSWWDLENFADYFIGETYYVNDDWIGDWTNNIKLWRERKAGSEWRYIFWDLDFGLGYYSDFAQNKLAVAMNPPYPTPHADMFRGLLENDGFRKYFINRYADLINTTYQPAYMSTFINEMKDSIAAEIPNAWLRWNGYSDSTEWLNNIDYMNYFISNRPSFARQHIKNTFNLEALVQVKLEALPSSAGEIKINTIIPEPLPWTGTYFDGNPITITAVAKPGYTFEYWLPNSYISMNTSQSLTINLDHFDTFKAVFTGSAEPAKAIISEVNYHSDSTINAGDWIELHNYSSQPLDLTDWHLYDSQALP